MQNPLNLKRLQPIRPIQTQQRPSELLRPQVAVVVLIELFKKFLEGRFVQAGIYGSDQFFEGLVAPGESVGVLRGDDLAFAGEAEIADLLGELFVGDAAVEVVVDAAEHFVDLGLGDRVAQALQQVLELLYIYPTVLV